MEALSKSSSGPTNTGNGNRINDRSIRTMVEETFVVSYLSSPTKTIPRRRRLDADNYPEEVVVVVGDCNCLCLTYS